MSAAVDESQVELACVEVRGQVFGMDIQQVREIVRSQSVTRLPKAPALIEGVIDLRGVVVPVIDLARALGEEPLGEVDGARIAVVEVEGLGFGLRVDAASDVVAVAGSAVEGPPALVSQAGYEAVRAVVRRDGGRPILVLSLEHLLESVYRSALSEGESTS